MNNNCLRQEKVLSASVLPKLLRVVVFIYSCMNFLTGHYIIAANNLLVHLKLWHVTWQCWYSSLQVASTATIFSQNCSRFSKFSKFSWGMPSDPLTSQANTAKPSTSYFASMVMLTITSYMKDLT